MKLRLAADHYARHTLPQRPPRDPAWYGRRLHRVVLCLLTGWATGCFAQTMPAPSAAASVFDQGLSLTTLDGSKTVDLSAYKGKKLLLVNVASKCGYTPQYADLQALHEKHGDQVVILGFPSNDFGGQEPGTAEEIATFCRENYGVTFPLFQKISVKKGSGQHALYQWLSDKSLNGWNDQAPGWNFCKYLVNEQGALEKFFPSAVKPMGKEILEAIGK